MIRAREHLVSTAVSGAIAAAVVWLLPSGSDWAAHVYQRSLFGHHGFALWDNLWYGGRYTFVDYSVIYYPLSWLLGMRLLAVVSVLVAAVGFRSITEHEWPDAARWPNWLFVCAWPLTLVTGALPFELGAALALLAIAVLQRRRNGLFALAALATLMASPLAFALLLVVCAAAAFARRRPPVAPAVALVALIAVEVLIWRIFPGTGSFPFAWAQLLAVVAFCAAGLALTWGVDRARVLFALFAVYLVACLGAFIIPSAVGGNVARLRLVALPLLALVIALRGWRPLAPAVVVMVLALSWNLAPVARSLTTAESDPAAAPSFWAPTVRYIRAHASAGFRVEVVSTADHWDAAYLPGAGVPIARGWFRQSDFPENALLYGRFTPRAYHAWLGRLSVAYVVLPKAPLDYSAEHEAAVVRAGQPWLKRVFTSPGAVVYRVRDPQPLVRGPGKASVRSLTSDRLVIDLQRPGTYRVAVRYSRFWRTSEGCVVPDTSGMLVLHARHAGVHVLDVAFRVEAAVDAVTNAAPSCAQPVGPSR